MELQLWSHATGYTLVVASHGYIFGRTHTQFNSIMASLCANIMYIFMPMGMLSNQLSLVVWTRVVFKQTMAFKFTKERSIIQLMNSPFQNQNCYIYVIHFLHLYSSIENLIHLIMHNYKSMIFTTYPV